MAELVFPSSVKHPQIIPQRLLNLLALYSKDDNFLKTRYSENFAYGHQEILLKYCGLELSTQIIGVLQHGAARPDFLEDVLSPRYVGGYKTKYWAWSKATQELAQSQGHNHVIPIGAPWLYLRKAIKSENHREKNMIEKVLIMPSHSTGNAVDVTSFALKCERARLFREVVGNREATVCLHATDFCDPETRAAFKKYNFELECIGSSSFQPVWSPAGNRVGTLRTLLDLMVKHTHYVSDCYGTSLVYALDLDMNVAIFPYLKSMQELNASSTGKDEIYRSINKVEEQFLPENMPKLLNNFVKGSVYQEMANTLLGAESVLSSEKLRNLLEYRRNVYSLSGDFQPW
jgi:hypothetical protein